MNPNSLPPDGPDRNPALRDRSRGAILVALVLVALSQGPVTAKGEAEGDTGAGDLLGGNLAGRHVTGPMEGSTASPAEEPANWRQEEAWPLPSDRRWLDRPAEPVDLADSGARIYVADAANAAVRSFDGAGAERPAWHFSSTDSCAAAPLALAIDPSRDDVYVVWSYLPRDPTLPEARILERRDLRGSVIEQVTRDVMDLVVEPSSGALISLERDERGNHLVYRDRLTAEPRWRVSPGRPDDQAGSLAISGDTIAVLESGGRRLLRFRVQDGQRKPSISIDPLQGVAVEAESDEGWSVLVRDTSPLPSARKLLLRFDALGRPQTPILASAVGAPAIPAVDWNFSFSRRAERLSLVSGVSTLDFWFGSLNGNGAGLSLSLSGATLRSGGVTLTCPETEAQRLGLEVWEDPLRFGTQVEVLDGQTAQLLQLDASDNQLRPSLPLDPSNPVLHFLRTEAGELVLLTGNSVEKRKAGNDMAVDWALGCACKNVTDLASAKGEIFLAQPATRTVLVLDLKNGAELRRWKAPPGAGHWPASLASDGKRVWASDSVRGSVHSWPAIAGAWPGGYRTQIDSLTWGMLPGREPGLVLGLSNGDIAMHAAADGRLFFRAPRPEVLAGHANGVAFGLDPQGRLISIDAVGRTLRRHVVADPAGAWTQPPAAPTPRMPARSCSIAVRQRLVPNPTGLGSPTRLSLDLKEVCPTDIHQGYDIVLVIDSSRSMFGDALDATRSALHNFIHALPEGDHRIALISYDDDARVHADFDDDRQQLSAAIDALEAEGRTRLSKGLSLAMEVLGARRGAEGRESIVLVVTDGQPSAEDDPRPAALDLTRAGIELLTILLTDGQADATLLEISNGRVMRAAGDESLLPITTWLASQMSVQPIGRVELRQALAADLRPDEDSFLPQQFRETDSTYRWGASQLSPEGITLTFEAQPLRSGLLPVHEKIQLRFRDYQGTIHHRSPSIEVLRVLEAPSATPDATPTDEISRAPARVWLPLIVLGLGCEERKPFDTMIVVDRSTSMLEPIQGGSKLLAARLAAQASIPAAVNPADRLGVIAADSSPKLVFPLSPVDPTLHAQLESLAARAIKGGSRLDLAIDEASAVLATSPRDLRSILILTDGRIEADTEGQLRDAAHRARAQEIDLIVLGIGAEISSHVFGRLTEKPGHFEQIEDVDRAASSVERMLGTWRCPPPR